MAGTEYLVEARDKPGGRAYVFEQDGFTFDAGPTIITAPYLLDDLFTLAGRRIADYVAGYTVAQTLGTTRELLEAHGVSLTGTQQTKTRSALEFFSKLAVVTFGASGTTGAGPAARIASTRLAGIVARSRNSSSLKCGPIRRRSSTVEVL